MDWGKIKKTGIDVGTKIGSGIFHGAHKLLAKKAGDPQEALYANKPQPQAMQFNPSAMNNPGLSVQPKTKEPKMGPLYNVRKLATQVLSARVPRAVQQPVQAGPTPTEMPRMPVEVTPTVTPEAGKTRIISDSGWKKVEKSAGVPEFFDYEQYRKSGSYVPAQPPREMAQLIYEEFPQEATKAALAASTESGFNPNAYNFNSGAKGMYANSQDYGLFQINDVTLKDYMRRFPKQVKALGINSVEDLRDPRKNAKMAKLIRQYQGWGAWYGPKNRGFQITD